MLTTLPLVVILQRIFEVTIGVHNEQDLRKRRCCFTGHRPEKLSMPEDKIIAALEHAIRAAIEDGYQTFISGMARGVDLWAAEIVLRLRDAGEPVRLICASPYAGFERAGCLAGTISPCDGRCRSGEIHLSRIQPRMLPAAQRMDGGAFGAGHRCVQRRTRRHKEHDRLCRSAWRPRRVPVNAQRKVG